MSAFAQNALIVADQMKRLNHQGNALAPPFTTHSCPTYNAVRAATAILGPVTGLAEPTRKTLGFAFTVAASEQRAFCQR